MSRQELTQQISEYLANYPEAAWIFAAALTLLACIMILWSWRRKKSIKPAQASAGSEQAAEQNLDPKEPLPSKESLLKRLADGLTRSRSAFSDGLSQLLQGEGKLNQETLESLHELLYRADVGVGAADLMVSDIKRSLSRDDALDPDKLRSALAESALGLLQASDVAAFAPPSEGPLVILMVGVNGAGKTTSIGKLAQHFSNEGKKVVLAAGDTFRAAATEQLKIWGERLGVEVVSGREGADPAAVAFDSLKSAQAKKADVLIIDTAGRLHVKKELMAELHKIKKVIGRDQPQLPHETLLVIDATNGQNAVHQVETFHREIGLTGIILTKLDGTAKGGVVLGISHKFGLPIRFVGVGEKAHDLQRFDSKSYVESLLMDGQS